MHKMITLSCFFIAATVFCKAAEPKNLEKTITDETTGITSQIATVKIEETKKDSNQEAAKITLAKILEIFPEIGECKPEPQFSKHPYSSKPFYFAPKDYEFSIDGERYYLSYAVYKNSNDPKQVMLNFIAKDIENLSSKPKELKFTDNLIFDFKQDENSRAVISIAPLGRAVREKDRKIQFHQVLLSLQALNMIKPSNAIIHFSDKSKYFRKYDDGKVIELRRCCYSSKFNKDKIFKAALNEEKLALKTKTKDYGLGEIQTIMYKDQDINFLVSIRIHDREKVESQPKKTDNSNPLFTVVNRHVDVKWGSLNSMNAFLNTLRK